MDVVSRIRTRVSAIQKAMAAAAAGVEEIRQAIADLRNERQKIASAPVPASEATALFMQMLDRWEAGGRNRYIGIEPIVQAATSGQVPQIEIHQSATVGHVLPARASFSALACSFVPVTSTTKSSAYRIGRCGLLVPLLRPQLEAALTAAVAAHYQTVPPGLPAAERVARLREIDAELGKLEAAEEEAIAAAEDGGLQIPRRPDASPAAVLGISQ